MAKLNYNSVRWTVVRSNIEKMQHDIVMAVRAKDKIHSKHVRMLQKRLVKSVEARMMAFRIVITNRGGAMS